MAQPGTAAPSLDLNADVGESFGQWQLGDDDAIMAQVSSASIACGSRRRGRGSTPRLP